VHLVFHNNLHGNSVRQVFSQDAVELSDTRVGSPTFGQGNYWGRSCPSALFLPGSDSNGPAVLDSHPYGLASAWLAGRSPGCATEIPEPLLITPEPGAVVATTSPVFTGVAVPGATVVLLEAGSPRGSTITDASGGFSVTSLSPFTEGAHVVTARAELDGGVSPDSTPLAFTVDTQGPSAPRLAFPTAGATVLA
jgi:hypothetical protein